MEKHRVQAEIELLGIPNRDKRPANLLRPNISEVCAAARQCQPMCSAASFQDLDASRGLLVLNADARPCFSTDAAYLLLARFCEKGRPADPTALPEPARSWVDRQIAIAPSANVTVCALEIRLGGAMLILRLISAGDASCHLLLMEERAAPRPGETEKQGLTRRESEVLHWVARGKTNEEIGIILGTSIHTVKSHVKRILAELGVETRTAAAAWALERQGTPSVHPLSSASLQTTQASIENDIGARSDLNVPARGGFIRAPSGRPANSKLPRLYGEGTRSAAG